MSGTDTGSSFRLWSKYFILIMFAALFTSICVSILDSTLVLFATDSWGSKKIGGLLTSAFNAGSIIMAFFSGKLSDRFGRRKCYLTSALLFAAATLMLAFFPYKAVAITVRFIQGCAKGVISVAAASIVADIVPHEHLGEGMSYYGLSQTLPKALGPMIGLAIVAGGDYRLLFLVCAGAYLIAAGTVQFVNYESDPKYRNSIEAAKEQALEDEASNRKYKGIWKLIEKKALIPSIIFTIVMFSTSIILVFLTDYARDVLLIPNDKIAYYYTVSSITVIVVRLFSGKLSDKHGPLAATVPGLCCQVVALFFLAYLAKQSYALFLAAAVLNGFGNAVVMPALSSVSVVDSPAGRSSAANATFYFMMDVGVLIASALMGSIVDAAASPAAGYRISFLLSIGVCVLALVLCVLTLNKKARTKRRNS